MTSAARTLAPVTGTVTADAPFLMAGNTPADVDPSQISRFGDDRWHLWPLCHRPHGRSLSVNWASFPSPLRDPFRRAGWALVNLPTPQELLERPQTHRAVTATDTTVQTAISNWRRFAHWLTGRGRLQLADVDEDDLHDYAVHLLALNRGKGTTTHALYAISRLWGYAPHLPATDRIPVPPWEIQGFRHFLPADTTPNENTTPPIHPAVIAPLLTWAMRFTDDLAEDIIAARAERDRLRARITTAVSPAAERILTGLFEEHLTTGTPIPATRNASGGYGIAKIYLAALAGTERNHAFRIAQRYRGRLPLGTGCPLSIPVSGRIEGRPWTAGIDYNDVPQLVALLQTACLIIISYLSGMRPGEALNLKTGCCPQPSPDPDGAIRYEVHGDYYKGAVDADGLPAPGGAPRRLPWIVIAPVARAIAIAERLADDERLFPARPGIAQRKKTMSTGGANSRITRFITYVNAMAAARGLDRETIPGDPDGTINILRFRRTVAWHIARLPGGRIALATQYGHLRTAITAEGYAGRSRHGLARIMDIETAHAAASYLADLADRIASGEAISGPASGRLIAAAKAASTSFAGMVLTPRQINALLTEPRFQVYDHPDAFLTCNYDPAKALCDPRRATRRPASERSPSLGRCRSECANIARTDQHIDALRAETARLASESASPLTPQPLRDRLAQHAATLRDILERHQRTRTTTGAADADDR